MFRGSSLQSLAAHIITASLCDAKLHRFTDGSRDDTAPLIDLDLATISNGYLSDAAILRALPLGGSDGIDVTAALDSQALEPTEDGWDNLLSTAGPAGARQGI